MLLADTMHAVGWLLRLLLLAVIAPTGLLFAFLVFAGTDIVVFADGVVVPRARVHPVGPAKFGTLKQRLVEPGDTVAEGEAMAVLVQGNDNDRIFTLRAPFNATVEEVSAHEPGDYVAGDVAIARLRRSGGGLDVFAGVHPKDIDQLGLRVVREIVVRDAALGRISARARLNSIGTDVTRDLESSGGGLASPGPIYVATLELEDVEKGPQRRGRTLQEGSKVKVEFNLGWQNFLERFVLGNWKPAIVPCFER